MKNKKKWFAIGATSLLAVCAVCFCILFGQNVGQNQDANSPAQEAAQQTLDSAKIEYTQPQAANQVNKTANEGEFIVGKNSAEATLAKAMKQRADADLQKAQVKEAQKAKEQTQESEDAGEVVMGDVFGGINVSGNTSSSSYNTSANSNDIWYKYDNGTLSIRATQATGYEGFDSHKGTPDWFYKDYRKKGKITRVVIEEEVSPYSANSWFGCIENTTSGNVQLSNIESITGISRIKMNNVESAAYMFAGSYKISDNGDQAAWNEFCNSIYTNKKLKDATAICALTQDADYGAKGKGLSNSNLNSMCYALAPSVENASWAFNQTKMTGTSESPSFANENIPNFQNCTNIDYMFYRCLNLTDITMTNLLNTNVTNLHAEGTFRDCAKLAKIIFTTNPDWSTVLTKTKETFKGCDTLIGGNGTSLKDGDDETSDKAKADWRNHDGYFTFVASEDARTVELTYDWEAYNNFTQVVPENASFTVQPQCLEPPTQEGKTFEGWSTTEGSTTAEFKAGDELKPTSAQIEPRIILYPVFKDTPSVDYFAVTIDDDTASGNAYIDIQHRSGLNLSYKINDEKEWHELTGTTWRIKELNNGDKVIFKGNNPDGFTLPTTSSCQIKPSNKFNISGQLTSLIYSDETNSEITSVIPSENCFYGLFKGSTNLVSISSNLLPFTTLKPRCYSYMFSGCSSLENISGGFTLPAKTLPTNCYESMFETCKNIKKFPDGFTISAESAGEKCCYYMFSTCSSLTELPDGFTLPAETLQSSCYSSMFNKCTSLEKIPAGFTLPAKTLQSSCYSNMFNGCSGLTELPVGFTLPATKIASSCYYYMFNGCSGLTKLPDGFTLPATEIADSCYAGMFYECSDLTKLPDDFTLPAESLKSCKSCYRNMFYKCSSLTQLPDGFKLPATEIIDSCYYCMFYECSGLTKLPDGFTLPAKTLQSSCYSSMFNKCTSLEKIPAGFTLPATELASSCYSNMFNGCSGLTKLPDGFTLPATELASSCYKGMFNGCSSLTELPDGFILLAEELKSSCYQGMFQNCSNLVINRDSGKQLIVTIPSAGYNKTYVQDMFTGTKGSATEDIYPGIGVSYYFGDAVTQHSLTFNKGANIQDITDVDGISISQVKCDDGADYSFKVVPDDGCTVSSVTVARAEGDPEELSPVDGIYTIENVTTDCTINTAAEKPEPTGYPFTFDCGKDSTVSDRARSQLQNEDFVDKGNNVFEYNKFEKKPDTDDQKGVEEFLMSLDITRAGYERNDVFTWGETSGSDVINWTAEPQKCDVTLDLNGGNVPPSDVPEGWEAAKQEKVNNPESPALYSIIPEFPSDMPEKDRYVWAALWTADKVIVIETENVETIDSSHYRIKYEEKVSWEEITKIEIHVGSDSKYKCYWTCDISEIKEGDNCILCDLSLLDPDHKGQWTYYDPTPITKYHKSFDAGTDIKDIVAEWKDAHFTKEEDEDYRYIHDGFSPSSGSITGDTNINVSWKQEAKTYTISFKAGEGCDESRMPEPITDIPKGSFFEGKGTVLTLYDKAEEGAQVITTREFFPAEGYGGSADFTPHEGVIGVDWFDITVTVKFNPATYTMRFTAGTGCKVEPIMYIGNIPSGTHYYTSGNSVIVEGVQTRTINPADGYEGPVQCSPASEGYVTSDITLTVSFKKATTFTVNFSTGTGCEPIAVPRIDDVPSGTHYYTSGNSIIVEGKGSRDFTPKSGYKGPVQCTPASDGYVTSNMTLTAFFNEAPVEPYEFTYVLGPNNDVKINSTGIRHLQKNGFEDRSTGESPCWVKTYSDGKPDEKEQQDINDFLTDTVSRRCVTYNNYEQLDPIINWGDTSGSYTINWDIPEPTDYQPLGLQVINGDYVQFGITWDWRAQQKPDLWYAISENAPEPDSGLWQRVKDTGGITAPIGDRLSPKDNCILWLKGKNPEGFNYLSDQGQISSYVGHNIIIMQSSGNVQYKAVGSVMSLVNNDSTNSDDWTSFKNPTNACFKGLFKNQTCLVDGPILSAKLSDKPDKEMNNWQNHLACYSEMFSGCTQLGDSSRGYGITVGFNSYSNYNYGDPSYPTYNWVMGVNKPGILWYLNDNEKLDRTGTSWTPNNWQPQKK